MSQLIVPRPIAFVSTEGVLGPNIAPFSYFMPGGPVPASLCFCIIRGKDGHKKATQTNIESHPEFVVNLVNRSLSEQMNAASATYNPDVLKWDLTGLLSVESQFVKPHRILASPVQFECRTFQLVEHGAGTYVIGEILAIHINEALYDPDSGKIARFDPVARLGGTEYIDLDGGKVFEITRPQ